LMRTGKARNRHRQKHEKARQSQCDDQEKEYRQILRQIGQNGLASGLNLARF
jgi:hypothetical protein